MTAFHPRVTPWQIDEADFYELDSVQSRLEFLVRYAVLAPSTRNTQPWLFRVDQDGVDVFADYGRQLVLTDPEQRELLMSVGAAMMNFRVAAAWFGFETTVLYERRREETVPLARIAVRETCATDETLRELLPAIRRRHTNRRAFNDEPMDAEAVTAICDLIDAHPETFRLIRWQDRDWMINTIAEGERRLMQRPAVREELADWLTAENGDRCDGICVDALDIPGPFSATEWLLRKIDVGDIQARRDRAIIRHAGAMILVTADDDRIALIEAGALLERLLLTVTRFGLQYTFMNQPLQVPDLRRDVQEATTATRPPQLLVCVGYAPEPSKFAPRRPVQSVVIP